MGKDVKREKLKKELSAPTRRIDYQVDTLQTKKNTSAYFSPDKNTITVNYYEGKDNSFNESRSTKAHEQKHRDNTATGMLEWSMSLEQHYKVCVHNETSANICELLEVREAYKAAKTPKERAQIAAKNSKFDYYFEAIKEGHINPLSSKSVDFEKEMEFIGKRTWLEWKFFYGKNYDDNHLAMTREFLERNDYDKLKKNDDNYNKALKIAYTIGGIDFSKYIPDERTFVNTNTKEADKLIARNVSRSEIKQMLKAKTSFYGDNPKLAPIKVQDEPDLSLRQQLSLAEHQLFVRNLNQMYDFSNLLKGKYETNNINVAIDGFLEDIKTNPKLKEEWQTRANQIAAEVAENNKTTLFFSKGDDELYKKKLKEIYTINGVCLLDSYKKDIEKLIPRAHQGAIIELEDSSFWDRAKKKCVSMKNKAKQFINGTKEKNAKKEFTSEFNKGKPQYATYSKDKRVSPVLYAEICDFRKPFLKQEQKQRTLAEAKTKAAVSNAKLAQRTSRKPDKVLGKKNPAAKKKAPVKKAEFHRKSDGDWMDAVWQKLKSFTR